MNITPINQILSFPVGTHFEAFQGTIKKVTKYTSGKNSYGEWSVQNCIIADSTGEIKCKLTNRPQVTDQWVGVGVAFIARKSEKTEGAWVGLSRVNDTYRDVTSPCIQVDRDATMIELSQLDHQPRQAQPIASPEPTKSSPAPAQQAATASPQSHPVKRDMVPNGQRIGMAINKAVDTVIADKLPWNPQIVMERASDIIRISEWFESGNLCEKFSERNKSIKDNTI